MSEEYPLHRPHGLQCQYTVNIPQSGKGWTEVRPGQWQFIGTKRQCLAQKKRVHKEYEQGKGKK